MNTQLLLGGAVSDHLQTNGKPKTTFTLGFPITITPPSPDDKKLENAVAEIEISVCAESTLESPSVVTLLPQERTYNVASLVDKSFLGSISAVLGGVVNVGGSFLWGHKTYYLVQQQETVAMMRPGRLCQDGSPDVSFAWQIRPVLGNPFLRPGDSTNFVQVSVPGVPNNGSPTQEIGTACVSVHWRLGDKKGNYLGRAVDRQGPVCYPISYYSTSQRTDEVTVTDIGQGNVHVNVTGTFLPGSMVRVGSTLLNPTTITTTHDALTFDVPAKAIIAAEGVYLVGRDNRQQPVVEQRAYQEKQLTINWLDICPYSDTLSKVKIGVSLPKESTPGVVLANASLKRRNGENPWLVLIGDKIFGLSDAPFFAQDDSSITVLAPTDLIRTSNSVEVRRLLWPDTYRDSKPIPSTIFAKTAPIVSKVSVVSSQNGLTLALEGSGLQDLRLEFPKCGGCVIKSSGDTFATVRLAKPDPPAAKSVKKGKRPIPKAPAVPDPTAGLKQILVCRGKPQSQDPQPAHTGQPKNAEPFSDCDEGYPVLPLDVPNLTPPATSVASKSST